MFRKPAVALFSLTLFAIGLASLAIMVGLQSTLGGAHLKKRSEVEKSKSRKVPD